MVSAEFAAHPKTLACCRASFGLQMTQRPIPTFEESRARIEEWDKAHGAGPPEPTPKMITAGMNTILYEERRFNTNRPWLARQVWLAMERARTER